MSSSVDVQRRQNNFWSYFSFSNTGPRRRTSLSLPLKSNSTFDPFEKADRHANRPSASSSNASSLMNDFKSSAGSTMNQGQRTRYLKAGGIIAFILCVFFFLSPSQKSVGAYLSSRPSREAYSQRPPAN